MTAAFPRLRTCRARPALVLLLAGATLAACGRPADHSQDGHEAEPWAVTAWTDAHEIFAEVEPLVAGKPASSNTHVTVLADFSPLREGKVSAILRGPAGEAVFTQARPRRDGIFVIELRPAAAGTFSLSYRVEHGGKRDEIPAGRVRVGSEAEPGSLVEGPAPPHGAPAAAEGGIEVPFLKEQQWRTPFSTVWARAGRLPGRVAGPARVLPAAGGEATLTAAVDATVASRPWPYPGQAVAQGDAALQLVPRVAGDRSLAQLDSEVAALAAEEGVARARAARLAELLALEAVSRAEADRAQAAADGLAARLDAARRDRDTAASARTGSAVSASLPVRAPFSGRVAEVSVTPGQSVAAGTALARLVRTRPVWLALALPPVEAGRLREAVGLFVRRPGAEPLEVPRSAVRVVSRSPELDPRTATLAVVLEVDRDTEVLPIGSAVEAEVLTGGEGETGTIVPAEAVVDDNGVSVVYEQTGGESFVRREVRLLGRAGNDVSLQGLPAGARVATRGAAAIRRASLLSSGAPEGHVH